MLLIQYQGKINTNAQKLANILAWFQRSGRAWGVKDLDKEIPVAGGISGSQYRHNTTSRVPNMLLVHVKDYLQALLDDNKIKVEKIGAGNWYWSFAQEEKAQLTTQLERAEEEKKKVLLEIETIKAKLDEAAKEREDDDDSATEHAGMDRKSTLEARSQLAKDVALLRNELALYRDSDPHVLNEKKKALAEITTNTSRLTDNIYAMEKKMKELVPDKQQAREMKKQMYGDEFDAEEDGLRELPAF